MNILAAHIGTVTSIPNWPTNDLNGLFDALSRWQLDPSHDCSKEPEFAGKPFVAPFRGRAWGHCIQQYDEKLRKRVFIATKPIHPDHPDAVRYSGNFLEYSFGFWLDTDDPHLIERLDQAIAANLHRT